MANRVWTSNIDGDISDGNNYTPIGAILAGDVLLFTGQGTGGADDGAGRTTCAALYQTRSHQARIGDAGNPARLDAAIVECRGSNLSPAYLDLESTLTRCLANSRALVQLTANFSGTAPLVAVAGQVDVIAGSISDLIIGRAFLTNSPPVVNISAGVTYTDIYQHFGTCNVVDFSGQDVHVKGGRFHVSAASTTPNFLKTTQGGTLTIAGAGNLSLNQTFAEAGTIDASAVKGILTVSTRMVCDNGATIRVDNGQPCVQTAGAYVYELDGGSILQSGSGLTILRAA